MNTRENFPLPVILAAVAWELQPLRKRFHLEKTFARRKSLRLEIRRGPHGPFALGLTGLGPQEAYASLEILLDTLTPGIIFSVGFAGALQKNLAIGDVVLAQQCHEIGGTPASLKSSLDLQRGEKFSAISANLQNLLRAKAIKFVSGPLLSSPHVVGTPSEKLALQSLPTPEPALAVEMETAALLKSLSDRGQGNIPLLSIRTISDALQDDVDVDFSRFHSAGGRIKPWGGVQYFLQNPGASIKLMRLVRNARQAAANLANLLEICLENMPRLGI